MRVLIACEYSGVVRDAFTSMGHDAWSCDLLPTEQPGQHYQGSVLDILYEDWDLMIGHPPCTYLAVSGIHWNKKRPDRAAKTKEGLEFVKSLMLAPIPRICIENPVSVISTQLKKPSQIIQPWQFGHGETKATCLWLKNLPLLKATNIVEGREQRIWKMPPGPNRWKERSRTFTGIAQAMGGEKSDTIRDFLR